MLDAPPDRSRSLEFIRLPGLTRYADALQVQLDRRCAVEEKRAGNAVFVLEHAPVITLGRKANPANMLLAEAEFAARGIDVHATDRGGDVTYHGPGQMVAYPILDLMAWQPSIRGYLRTLEGVIIRLLACYGLKGEREEGFTGVWVGGAKVAAIGVGIHNWTTFHGLALNVCPNMAHFGYIIPCGLQKPVTSLAQLLPDCPPMATVMGDFERVFTEVFREMDPESL